jgi:hypothetical protein
MSSSITDRPARPVRTAARNTAFPPHRSTIVARLAACSVTPARPSSDRQVVAGGHRHVAIAESEYDDAVAGVVADHERDGSQHIRGVRSRIRGALSCEERAMP